jgi:hypothetical protein
MLVKDSIEGLYGVTDGKTIIKPFRAAVVESIRPLGSALLWRLERRVVVLLHACGDVFIDGV